MLSHFGFLDTLSQKDNWNTTRPSSEAQSHFKNIISDNNKIRLIKTDKNFSSYCVCPSKYISRLPNLAMEYLWGISQLFGYLRKGWPNTTGCINEPSIPVSSPCAVRPAQPTQHRKCCLKSNKNTPLHLQVMFPLAWCPEFTTLI